MCFVKRSVEPKCVFKRVLREKTIRYTLKTLEGKFELTSRSEKLLLKSQLVLYKYVSKKIMN